MRIAVFDAGGTFIKYALGDEKGNLAQHGKVLTPRTKEDFCKIVHLVVSEYGSVEGLAFSLPGFVDAERGYISLGGSLRYHDDCYFVREMTEEFQLPVTIQNDAKCAALAEVWRGNAAEYKNAVVLVFGTGIGGALIQEGKVYMGSHYMSSELSCVIQGDIRQQGFDAILGNQFSIPKLMERIAGHLGVSSIEGQEAFEKMRSGNREVTDEFEKYYARLAVQVFNFQCFYDPDVFLIGGGISVQEEFVEGIRKAVTSLEERIPFPLPKIRVESTTFKAEANLLGALYQFLK